jgi:DNA-binding GntR family transcriptional regulator
VGDLSYLDMADDLARQLRGAVGGSRVASEHELAAVHGVSRPTARAALQELERRYLVRRVRGAGTFVHRRIDYVIGPDTPPSWSDAMLTAGHEPGSSVERRRVHRAGAWLRRRLELPEDGQVTSLLRHSRLDGHPSGVSTSHVPLDLAPDLSARIAGAAAQPRLPHVSVYHLLKDGYGLDPVRTWTTASLEVPPSDVVASIGLEVPEPTWFVETVNRDGASGRPVEHSRSWLRADVYRVVLELGTPHQEVT